jgi:SLT domain-containing protein
MTDKNQVEQILAEDPPKNKGGRPKVKVDTKIIENMAAIHCTNKEIAEVVGISVDTLQRNFPDLLQKGRANGKAKLRRLQWQKAEEGNPTMLIWLGKQLLEQKEQPINNEDNQPLPWTD